MPSKHQDPKDARIEELEALVRELRAEIARLKAEIVELKAKLGTNSLNSSRPPSRDDEEAKKKRRAKAAKHAKRRAKEDRRKNRTKRGSLLPPDAVTSVAKHAPTACGACGHHLAKNDLLADPERIQKIDLPEIRPLVHEIQIYSGLCPCCGVTTKAERPAEASETRIGPQLRAMIVFLVGRMQLSRRETLEFLTDVFGIELSIGLLSKIERQTSEALDAAHAEAKVAISTAPVVHADETSWSYGGIPGWLWVASTGNVAMFQISNSRGADVAHAILEGRDGRVTVSDRWAAYAGVGRRQVCWAHLERNARALIDRGGETALVGERVVRFIRIMFSHWHRFLDGNLSGPRMHVLIRSRGTRLLRELKAELASMPRAAASFVRGLLKVEPHLFTFTNCNGVEPTNNQAERDLRRGVIWRRKSQATRSERGRRFVERMLTVVMTLRAQSRSVYQFLHELLSPDLPTPQLLPDD